MVFLISRSDELTLNAGLIVNVINKFEDGWWRIESEGNYGLYPSNYLEEINNVIQTNNGILFVPFGF
jgi:hypothetical protein